MSSITRHLNPTSLPSNTVTVPVDLSKIDRFWKELMKTRITDPAKEGWITSADFAAKYQLSRSRAQELLGKLVRQGKVERATLTWNGRNMAFYRPITGVAQS